MYIRRRIDRFWAAALLGCIVLLYGCASSIPLAAEARQRVATDLGIRPENIQSYDRCLAGRATRGATSTPMVECVYIQTADWAAILDYDPAAKKFKRAFTFDLQTKGVALATAANVLNTQYELQIDQQGSLLVVLLVNSDLGTLGVPDKLVFAAYDHLQSLGIPTIEPTPFVSRLIQGTPGTYYIPIYIPSRR